MMRWALPALLIATLLVSPVFTSPVAAANVDVTLIAENTLFKVGTTAEPTITVEPGDVIRFRVENRDSFGHTFTFPHFTVDEPLSAGATIFVNITADEADRGKWQFYCSIPGHATGPVENRDGMVGYVQVGAPPQPSSIGLEIILIIVGIVVVAVVVAVVVMRRRKGAA